MAEVERDDREQIELDIRWEKRQKKVLLICSAVCCVIGTIVGAVIGVREGGIENIIVYVIAGM